MTPEQFKHWRKVMGFSQADAAKALDVSLDTIKSYESGRLPIRRVVALSYAALYHRLEPWGYSSSPQMAYLSGPSFPPTRRGAEKIVLEPFGRS